MLRLTHAGLETLFNRCGLSSRAVWCCCICLLDQGRVFSGCWHKVPGLGCAYALPYKKDLENNLYF